MPVYSSYEDRHGQLCCYAHAGGNDIEALIEDIIRYNEEGYEAIRCQLGAYGGAGL